MLIYNRGNTPATGAELLWHRYDARDAGEHSNAPDLWPRVRGNRPAEQGPRGSRQGTGNRLSGAIHSGTIAVPAGNFFPGAEVKDLVERKKFLVMYGCVGYFTLDVDDDTPYCLYLIRDDALPGISVWDRPDWERSGLTPELAKPKKAVSWCKRQKPQK